MGSITAKMVEANIEESKTKVDAALKGCRCSCEYTWPNGINAWAVRVNGVCAYCVEVGRKSKEWFDEVKAKRTEFKSKYKCIISTEEMGIDYADSGRWRSYELDTHGNSMDECEENASVSETDQDGGEIDIYSLKDASSEVFDRAIEMITAELKAFAYRATKAKQTSHALLRET